MDEITDSICKMWTDSAILTFPNKPHRKGASKKRAAWFNFECKSKRQLYLKAKKRHNKIKSTESYANLKRRSREYKKEMTITQRAFRDKFNKELREMKTKDPKRYWKMLSDGKNSSVSSDQLPAFYDHFKNLATSAHTIVQTVPLLASSPSTDDGALNSDFTEREVWEGIANLKCGKAAGSDSVK